MTTLETDGRSDRLMAEVNPRREKDFYSLVIGGGNFRKLDFEERSLELGDILEYGAATGSIGMILTGFTKNYFNGLEPVFQPLWAMRDGEIDMPQTPHYHNRDLHLDLHFEERNSVVVTPIDEYNDRIPPHSLTVARMNIYREKSVQFAEAQQAFKRAQTRGLNLYRMSPFPALLGAAGSIFEWADRQNTVSVVSPLIIGGGISYLVTQEMARNFEDAVIERHIIALHLTQISKQFGPYFYYPPRIETMERM